MPLARPFAFVLFAVVALAAVGCGSNNKGKIVGKWKTTTFPGMSAEEKAKMDALGKDAVSLILEFTEAGKMTGNAEINVMGQTQKIEVMSADYTLGNGDWVNFTNLKPATKDGKTVSKDKITISGDTMTMNTEKGEKIVLTRVK